MRLPYLIVELKYFPFSCRNKILKLYSWTYVLSNVIVRFLKSFSETLSTKETQVHYCVFYFFPKFNWNKYFWYEFKIFWYLRYSLYALILVFNSLSPLVTLQIGKFMKFEKLLLFISKKIYHVNFLIIDIFNIEIKAVFNSDLEMHKCASKKWVISWNSKKYCCIIRKQILVLRHCCNILPIIMNCL